MEAVVYNQKGKESGKVSLPAEIFGLPWNADLVHQTVHGMMLNARANTAHTKDRGDVRGGGKKPWQQKGTGRARHGSSRSPIWVGGGVAHGPTSERNYSRKINKKMKTKALFTILSQKYKDGEVLFVDSLTTPDKKTKEVKVILDSLSSIKGFEKISKKKNAALVATPTRDAGVVRGFKNIGNVALVETRNINPVEVLQYKYVIMVSPEESLKALGAKRI